MYTRVTYYEFQEFLLSSLLFQFYLFDLLSMNIGHRIHARKVVLCYIYRALFYNNDSTQIFESKREAQSQIPTNSLIGVPDGEADFISSMGNLYEDENVDVEP